MDSTRRKHSVEDDKVKGILKRSDSKKGDDERFEFF